MKIGDKIRVTARYSDCFGLTGVVTKAEGTGEYAVYTVKLVAGGYFTATIYAMQRI